MGFNYLVRLANILLIVGLKLYLWKSTMTFKKKLLVTAILNLLQQSYADEENIVGLEPA